MRTSFAYAGIRVKDIDESIEFYTKVLGMKLMGRSKIGVTRGEVASLVSEGRGFPLELNHYDEGSEYSTGYAAGDGLDHLAFRVDDLERAIGEIEKTGRPLVADIRSETSRWVYIQDPNGIWIELYQG
jgi:lactoylglutathione lyase